MMRSLFYTGCVLLIFPCLLTADQWDQLRFKHLGIEDGLSNNTVLCIEQDDHGFMWFGTLEGLNRFDGYEFSVFKNDPIDSLTLSSNQILTLYFDRRKNLWVGTQNGLNLFRPQDETFTSYSPRGPDSSRIGLYIRSIIEDDKGNLWVGSSRGLFKFDTTRKTFVIHDPLQEIPSQIGNDNIVRIVPDPEGFFWICTTQEMKIFKDGRILPATAIQKSTPTFDPPLHIRTILQDRTGHYWLGAESNTQSLFRFDNNLISLPAFPKTTSKLPDQKIRVIKELSSGNIAIGALNGLFIYEKADGVFHHYKHDKITQQSLSHNSVRDIYEDKDGGIWLATYRGGVNYFHPFNTWFQLIQEEPWKTNSLSNDVVTSIVEDRKNNLWISTEQGLNYYDTQKGSYSHFYQSDGQPGLLDNVIKTLALDGKGNLWIGSLTGLSRFVIQEQRFDHFVHDPDDPGSIAHGHVHEILIDADQQVWIGTNGGGLSLYLPEKNEFQRFHHQDSAFQGLSGNQINALVEGDDDLIWIGTSQGLNAIHRKNHQFIPPLVASQEQAYLLQTLVNSLYHSPAGFLWIGTGNHGLVCLQPLTGQIFSVDQHLGLANNTIKAILEDARGNIWVSTDGGISKIDAPVDGWPGTTGLKITNYGLSEGLQGLQYYLNSACQGKNGQFYFGGNQGLNTFFPEKIPEKTIRQQVVFTALKIRTHQAYPLNSREIAPAILQDDTPITLKYKESDFSISFSALNYIDPRRTVYAYQLDPLDQDWNVIGEQRNVHFKQLPAGSYTFRVRASNDPNRWEGPESQLIFQVLPPWWKSWIAIIGYVVLTILLLIAFFILATRWERLKTELKIEHLEREKEHELHQQKLGFFTDLSHELRTPLTLILAPLGQLIRQSEPNLRIRNQLIMIQRNGERMLNLINQILDIRKTETGHIKLKAAQGNIVKFLREVSLSFREMALIQKIDFYFNAADDVIELYFDRDKMEVVMYNLLSNAFKFTPPGGQISVIVNTANTPYRPAEGTGQDAAATTDPGWVEIIVQDNGRGIPKAIQEQIFQRFFSVEHSEDPMPLNSGAGIGLHLARKYIDLHHGEIEVFSVPTKDEVPGYTRFTIRLLLGCAHLQEAELIAGFRNSEDSNWYTHGSFVKEQLAKALEQTEPAPPGNIKSAPEYVMLIVEDNTDVRNYLRQLFERDFDIHEARDGQEGIDRASEIVPDIVISDVMMPNVDGMELCRTLKSDIRTSHIPIILLTARTAVSFRFEGLETGADDYISKPFSSEHLQLRVKNLIQQRDWIRRHFSSEQKLLPEHITLTSVDERLLRETINYIRSHLAEPELTVEKLSREVGLSRVHLYRKIKALTDLSPVEFIRNVRLECAAELLEANKFNVSEVRYQVGIHDADYFRKCFKTKYGLTPSDFVKEKVSTRS